MEKVVEDSEEGDSEGRQNGHAGGARRRGRVGKMHVFYEEKEDDDEKEEEISWSSCWKGIEEKGGGTRS